MSIQTAIIVGALIIGLSQLLAFYWGALPIIEHIEMYCVGTFHAIQKNLKNNKKE